MKLSSILIEEWHPTKNGTLRPSMVSAGSGQKVWWRCPKCGGEWEAQISSRSSGTGCPYCAGQKVLAGFNDFASQHSGLLAEWDYAKNIDVDPAKITAGSGQKVWWRCRKCGGEWKATVARRSNGGGCPYCAGQKVLKGFNDFATAYPELVKEWHPVKNGTLEPTMVTASSGKKVWWQCKEGHEWQAEPRNRAKGNGCPYCLNQKVLAGFNDLATTYPEVAKEWHPTKNAPLAPSDVIPGTKKKVWWQCKKGHEWQATLIDRTTKGGGCPICSGKKVLVNYNDLATANPKIAAEWHPTKNGELTPQDVTAGSNKKVWWECKEGHEWRTTVASRLVGTGCPYCANRKVLKGFNDLETVNPRLAAEWHPTKNGVLSPSQILAKSGKKVWWKCPRCGNEWETTVVQRARGTGCPNCSSAGTSFPEQAVFFYVKKSFNDAINRDRSLKYEFDIFIPSKRIAIEYDGVRYHSDSLKIEKDNEKDEYCLAHNITLFRIREKGLGKTNSAINLFRKNNTKNADLERCIKELVEHISPGSSEKVNIKHDFTGIMEQYYEAEKKNSIYEKVPDLIQDWHPTKNGLLDVKRISYGSVLPVWWKCHNCGHEWQQSVRYRVSGSGCPNCNPNMIKNKIRALSDENPELAAEWHPTKNGELSPDEIGINSRLVVWWKCPTCGHEWEATVASRNSKAGCPCCHPYSVNNALSDENPELAAEWHPTKNGELKPTMIAASSAKKVWWQCKKGHEWQARISHRNEGSGCPYCNGRRAIKGENDLATLNPTLAAEWHPTKNGELTPSELKPGSGKKVWWRCPKCGGEWEATVANRSKGGGCPYCAGQKVLKGFNDLATAYPGLAKEWHPVKNGALEPTMVTASSGKKVWWQCKEGHEWEATVASRSSGTGCPYCAGQKILKGCNDLATLNPTLAAEWHPTKNAPLKPSDIMPYTNKKYWWQCKEGHEWEATPNSRMRGNNCPICWQNRKKISQSLCKSPD